MTPVEAAKLKKIMSDPVLWARAFLISNDAATKKFGPWEARDYQAEMLRDRSLKKVYRCGRRCLPGWVKIPDPTTGEFKTVEELFVAGKANVISMDNSSYEMKAKNNCEVFSNGVKEVFKVRLSGGRSIDTTSNHPFFTASGWKELKDLKLGDYVAVPLKMDFFGEKVIDKNDVKLLAYMIGDGNCLKKNVRFSQKPESKQTAEMKEVVNHYGCELHSYEYTTKYDFIIRKKEHTHNRTVKNEVKETLIKYGVYGCDANTKKIPNEIFTLTKEQVALFLSRLYSTDGWASVHLADGRKTSNLEIGYCSNSEELVRGVSHLLVRFGIDSEIRKKNRAWTVLICSKNGVIRFAEEIGIYGKEDAVDKCLQEAKKKIDQDQYMPLEINAEIQKRMTQQGVSKSDLVRLWDNARRQNGRLRLDKYKLPKNKVSLIANRLGLSNIESMAKSDIIWKEVRSIESIGLHETYDLHVPEYHNFVANDIITHNTGKSETMVVEALWRAFTSTSREKFRILCITPYENQVNLLFMRMRELIHNSPLVKNEVVRMKNSPYMIEFYNGATILGFTTGASSGSGAASIRGQRGDLLLLDEIDYMGENDYSTVAMIAGERPDIAMICSSTPTGKRGTFYRMCKDPTFGFKEHFHPSMDNPNWNKQMEDEFRSQLTASQYEHEVLAEFGTEEAGVFDKTLIDAAMKKEFYIYNPLTEMQKRNLEDGYQPTEYIYDENNLAPYNPFRCVGVNICPAI
jgi:hypothetical protein|nr:MAG TPA: Terminase [Caudoviricetes sp.]